MAEAADREELYTALRNADKAGDTAAAQKLSSYIQALPSDAAPATPPAKPAVSPPEAPEQPKPNLMSLLGMIPGMGGITGPVEAGAQMLSGAVSKPVSDIAALAAMAKDVLSGGGGSGNAEGFKSKVQSDLTYAPRTEAGKTVAEYNPLALVGKATDWLGRKAAERIAPPGSSTEKKMAAAGVHEAINQAPQFFAPLVGKAVSSASPALKGTAHDLMQSALKPTVQSLRTGKAGKAADTMLEQGINVSPGGVQKMQGRIADLNSQIAGKIAGSPAIIDKGAVASRIQPLLDKFTKQVNATDDLAAIQKAHDDFINHPLLNGTDIQVQLAQELKQGTYRSLGDKSYGELKSASVEAQKSLARGLKEEIARAVPDVHVLNAEESSLLNALSVSERRVMLEANKNPAGFGLLTTNPVKFAGFMADRSGMFKSLVARMLNKTSKVMAAPMPGAKPAAILTSEEAGRSKRIFDDAEKERKYQEWKARRK